MSWCPLKALPNRDTGHKNTKRKINLVTDDMAMVKVYRTLCAQHMHSQLQPLAGNCVDASLSGHSSPMTLFSLVFSQKGH